MINAWSLLYDELYGDDEMTYPVENNELNDENMVINTGTGNTIFNVPEDVEIDEDIPEVVSVAGSDEGVLNIDGGYALNFDDYPTAFTTFADNDDSIAHHIGLSTDQFVNFDLGVGNTAYSDTLNISVSDPDLFASMDGVDLPTPGIKSDNPRKYKEDESIKALQEYISTTYGGHYTCLLYTSPSPRDRQKSRMPSSA